MTQGMVFGILIFLYLLLIWKAGKTYPVLYLFLFTFFVQYLFSTYLIYTEYKELRYQMPIKETQFFDYAIPAIGFLFLGVFLFNKDINIKDYLNRIKPQSARRLGLLLLVISYLFDVTRLLGLSWFSSFISFTTYFKYIAVFCFLFSGSTLLYILSGLVYLQLMFLVIRTGVFIDFIAWGTFLFFFISLRFNLNFVLRSGLFLAAIPILVAIQGVKDEYREVTWGGQQEGSIELFNSLMEKKSKENMGEPFSQTDGVVRTIGRLSQGWHLGLTLKRVPLNEPFANGDEMLGDVAASIVPRFLFPEKQTVHTKEKFYQFTGHKLRGSTSMTIGILGDFYVNFGRIGSFAMLFIFGALVSILVRGFLIRYVIDDPINIVWLPFLLSYLVRADNDFYIFFNCALKGFFIFLFINFIRLQFLERDTPRSSIRVPG